MQRICARETGRMAEATIRFRYAKTVKMPFVASQKRKERGFMAVPKDYNEQIKEIEKKEAQLKAQKRILKARQNKKAREDGCLFSFDPNLRPQLWPSTSAMTEYINKMAAKSDVFLPGINEAKILIGEDRPEEVARRYMEMGTQTVIVKLGAQGAYYADCRGNTGYVDGFPVSQVVDTVGAGDGFAAGVLSELLDGKPLEQAVKIGCAIGAIQVMSRGDNDGLPDIEELDAFIKGRPDWRKPND